MSFSALQCIVPCSPYLALQGCSLCVLCSPCCCGWAGFCFSLVICSGSILLFLAVFSQNVSGPVWSYLVLELSDQVFARDAVAPNCRALSSCFVLWEAFIGGWGFQSYQLSVPSPLLGQQFDWCVGLSFSLFRSGVMLGPLSPCTLVGMWYCPGWALTKSILEVLDLQYVWRRGWWGSVAVLVRFMCHKSSVGGPCSAKTEAGLAGGGWSTKAGGRRDGVCNLGSMMLFPTDHCVYMLRCWGRKCCLPDLLLLDDLCPTGTCSQISK